MLRMSISLCLRSNRHYLLARAELGGRGKGLGGAKAFEISSEK